MRKIDIKHITSNISKLVYKKPLFLIILIALTSISLSLNIYLVRQKKLLTRQNSTLNERLSRMQSSEKKESTQKFPNTIEEQETATDIYQLENFIGNELNKYPEFATEVKDKTVRKAYHFGLGKWVVETIENGVSGGSSSKKIEPRKTTEERHFYIVTPSYWKRITDEPMFCYTRDVQVIQGVLGVHLVEVDEEDRLVISGTCILENFISLHKLINGEKIPFSDPNDIGKNKIFSPSEFSRGELIDEQGNIRNGRVLNGPYGEEPVIVAEFGSAYGYNPPLGVGVFSVKTGVLVDLIDYRGF